MVSKPSRGNRDDECAGRIAVGTSDRVTAKMLQLRGLGSKTCPGEVHLQISVSFFCCKD